MKNIQPPGLPIGISDFRKLRENNCLYIDKTLFIKEILETQTEVFLFPRPRRFGKTLNLSMLRYFFEKSGEDRKALFQPYFPDRFFSAASGEIPGDISDLQGSERQIMGSNVQGNTASVAG